MVPKHILPVAMELMQYRLPTVSKGMIDVTRKIQKQGLRLYNQPKPVLADFFKQ
jgi:hypothetical protein